MKKITIGDLAWEESLSPKGKYHSFFKNISLALGGKRDTGAWGGGHPFDLQLRKLPPGAAVCPLHAHSAQSELFIIISGTATVRLADETHEVGTGDAFIQSPGIAHQISNTGTVDCLFYVIADNVPSENCYYPDSDKWMVKPQRKIFRVTEADYFDGEE